MADYFVLYFLLVLLYMHHARTHARRHAGIHTHTHTQTYTITVRNSISHSSDYTYLTLPYTCLARWNHTNFPWSFGKLVTTINNVSCYSCVMEPWCPKQSIFYLFFYFHFFLPSGIISYIFKPLLAGYSTFLNLLDRRGKVDRSYKMPLKSKWTSNEQWAFYHGDWNYFSPSPLPCSLLLPPQAHILPHIFFEPGLDSDV